MRFDRLSPAGVDRSVLVDVWREACRHIEIQESTHTIAGILGKLGPIGQLLVRKIDRQRSCLETVAVGIAVPDYLLPEARTTCDEGQLKDLLAWCRKRQVLHQDSARHCRDLLATIVPPGMTADVVAGTLGDAENPSGVVVLVAQPGTTFEDSHVCLVEALLEPFSVALENDQRLREMAAMRAAAEADKESLLKRLGRKKLTDTVVGAEFGASARRRARGPGGPQRCARSHPRRDGHGQGSHRAHDPHAVAAGQRPVPARELRSDPGGVDRLATLRS